ncbi:MAG: 3-oxoacid CoA-transferase subunit A [Dehalococcoidia bacterium]|jgi:acyl CoA:acetate/3-ketoacid CoA transferase alpha subunit
MVDKSVATLEEAIADVQDGAIIAIPGFFVAGVPRALLRGIIAKGVKHLTLACGCGALVGAREECELLVKNEQLDKVIDSYPLDRSATKGASNPFEQAVRAGKIEVEIFPMGTLAEKYRAAGAGIPAFYTPTGVGTAVEGNITNMSYNVKKDKKIFDGREYILEFALKPDFAFVHAYKGDKEGNLRYKGTARNFNHCMAQSAKITIAEVENLVEPGEIDINDVHTPGIYVKRIVKVERPKFHIGIG